MMTYWKKPQMQIIWNLIITVQRHAFPIDGRDDNIIGLISVCKQERVNRKKEQLNLGDKYLNKVGNLPVYFICLLKFIFQ